MAQGLSFAIPVDTAAWVIGELLAHGRVRRVRLGLAAQSRPIDPALARRLGIRTAHVVEIMSVEPGGPAAMAGLRSGDWIVAVDRQPTATVDDLHRRLAGVALGVSLKVAVIRGSASLDALVTPSEAL